MDGKILHRNTAGQSDVGERGNKRQDGQMLMYGTHNVYGVNATRLGLPADARGKQPHRPAAYLPDKPRDYILNAKVQALATPMSTLEGMITPAVATQWKAEIDTLDPNKMHRISDGCDSPGLSTSRGYIVAPHPDSGVNNEGILYANCDGSLVQFAAAGLIVDLPQQIGSAIHLSVSPGVWHGTMPTAQPHANLGAAIVTNKRLVRTFEEQAARGETTPTKLTASYVYRAEKRMRPIDPSPVKRQCNVQKLVAHAFWGASTAGLTPMLPSYALVGLESAVAIFDQVVLWQYEDVPNAPKGVCKMDARILLDTAERDTLLAKNVTIAHVADVVRFKAACTMGGWVIDPQICDGLAQRAILRVDLVPTHFFAHSHHSFVHNLQFTLVSVVVFLKVAYKS